MKKNLKNTHMIGIGGIGMSGIARLLSERGMIVSGCDIELNPLTQQLCEEGVAIHEGHSASHISKLLDAVVCTSAVSETHPEIELARELLVPVYRRAEILADLVDGKRAVSVTGTHGKTTVSMMLTHIFSVAKLDPSFFIGAQVSGINAHAKWGSGEHFILETDESDGSQKYIIPDIAIITNIDKDHLDYYKNEDDLAERIKEFIDKIPSGGLIVGWDRDKRIKKLMQEWEQEHEGKTIRYGLNAESDIFSSRVNYGKWNTHFTVNYKGKSLGEVTINMPGEHNVLNTLASIAVALNEGISFDVIKQAVSRYPRIKRRLEVLLNNDNITVVDDYAHHPSEIKAVINALSSNGKKRLIGVFQPHRFTRTKFLYKDFARCFEGLDLLILTDIYGAGEKVIDGVNGKLIYDEYLEFARDNWQECYYVPKANEIPKFLSTIIHPSDVVVFMGAGDITKEAHTFALVVGLNEKCRI